MSDQPENAAEPLPDPTPEETARLMREASHSKVPWWKRLLPPWVCSLGLHLFLLPFLIVVTVTFADKLFVPTVWDDYRAEKLGNEPYSNLIVDRDYPVEQLQEKPLPLPSPTGPLPTVHAPRPPETMREVPEPAPAPKAQPQPTAKGKTDPPAPAEFPISADEQAILDEINRVRASEKAAPLKPEKKFFDVARADTATLAKKQGIKQTTIPGYPSLLVLSTSVKGVLTPQRLVEAFTTDDLDRLTLVKPGLQVIGIGIAKAADGTSFYMIIIA